MDVDNLPFSYEKKVKFEARLDWTGQTFEWHIEDCRVYVNYELIWIIDDEERDIKLQLESILTLNHYQLERILSDDEIDPFYNEF
jgi:hypothetical protein